MKHFISGFFIGLLFLSCVSNPSVQTEKKQKETIIISKTPVLLKETLSFPDGMVDQYIKYTYDMELKRLLKKEVIDAARSEVIERTEYDYQDNYLSKETVFTSDGKEKFKHMYANNKDGLVLIDTSYDPKGKILSIQKNEYDENGLKILWRNYSGENILRAETIYSYENKKLVVASLKTGTGALSSKIRYEYDDEGKLQRRVYIDSKDMVEKTEELVYENAVLTEEIFKSLTNTITGVFIYGDIKDGVATKKIIKDGNGKIIDIRLFEYVIREDKKTVYTTE